MEWKGTFQFLEIPLWTRPFISAVTFIPHNVLRGWELDTETERHGVSIKDQFPQLVNGRVKIWPRVHRTTKIIFYLFHPSRLPSAWAWRGGVQGGKASWRKRHWTETRRRLWLAGWRERTPDRRWSKPKHMEIRRPGWGHGGGEIYFTDGKNTRWSIPEQTQMPRTNTKMMEVKHTEPPVMPTWGGPWNRRRQQHFCALPCHTLKPQVKTTCALTHRETVIFRHHLREAMPERLKVQIFKVTAGTSSLDIFSENVPHHY